MRKVILDFDGINDEADFYDRLEERLPLPDYFGRNADALYDLLSGDLELPLTLVLYHLTGEKKRRFEVLLETLTEAGHAIEGFDFCVADDPSNKER